MERYERYKDSGVEWLGEVPEHWDILKGKRLFIKQNRPARVTDDIVTCFRDGQVTLRSNRRIDGFTNAIKEIGYQGVRNGDFVIHNMDAFAGAIGVSDSDGKSTPVYSVCTPLKPNRINVYYYSYLLRSLALNGLILSLAKGIRERSTDFRFSDFGELEYYVPPIAEQGRIVAFLDEKCGQIDRAVEQKERMIELLQERRAATIQRAVTQGLDPTLPLKDSNIDWIGKIPTHWQIKKLKNLGRNFNGLTYSPNDLCDSESGTLVIRSSNVQNDKLSLDDNVYVSKRISNELLVRKGDIIICSRNGSASLIGKAALIESDITATFGAFMMIFKGNSNINKKYLYYLITVCIKQYKGLFSTSTINQLTNSMLGDIYTPFVAEEIKQQEIATYLDKVSTKTEQAIKLKRQEIERLKEYRQTLINSAVTGKIKID